MMALSRIILEKRKSNGRKTENVYTNSMRDTIQKKGRKRNEMFMENLLQFPRFHFYPSPQTIKRNKRGILICINTKIEYSIYYYIIYVSLHLKNCIDF